MTTTETAPRIRHVTLLCLVTSAIVGTLIGVALIGSTAITGVANASEVVSVALPIVRVLLDIAAITAIGLALLSVLMGYDRPKLSEPILKIARPAAVASSVIWAVSALTALVLQTAEFQPQKSLSLGGIWDYVAQIGAGKALLAVAVLALFSAGLGALAVKHGEKVPAEVRVGVGLFALLPLPVTGHASNWNFHDYTMISMELHVISAAAWTGGLGAMAVLLFHNRTLLAHALPRFSKLATVCLLVSTATGLFNGIVEINLHPSLDFLTGLFTTPYGQLILLKTLCTAIIAALGGYVRFRLMPLIVNHKRTAIATWATFELTVMGLAFGFAVVLTRAPVS